MRKKVKIFDIVLGIIMLVITFIAVYPLYYIYINSVSGGAYVGANEVIWYPKGFTTYAYSLVFQKLTTPVQALKFCARFLRHRSQNLPFLLVITSRNAGYRSYFVSTSTYNRICLIVLLFLYF